jgi:hypothetical protein
MASSNYRHGHEMANQRGQVFVMRPDHPNARKDGRVPRAHLVMESMLADGLCPGESYEDYALEDGKPQPGRYLKKDPDPNKRGNNELVWHRDEDASNDDPSNLMLFPSTAALAQHRSDLYAAKMNELDKKTFDDYNRRVREGKERRRAAALKGAAAAKRMNGRRKGASVRKARQEAAANNEGLFHNDALDTPAAKARAATTNKENA